MYLSRVRINNNKRDTIKFLSSLQVIHAAVEGCFADVDQSRKLWRLDYLQNQPYLLLLSQEKPDFAELVKQFGYDGDTGESRDYQGLLDSLKMGAQYRFRLCANPVVSLNVEPGKRGKVVPHVTIEYQEEWLRKRADAIGSSLDSFSVVQRGVKRFFRNGKKVTLHTADYEGILTITDADLFRKALTNGIGRAKSYGCGLLTLGRV